MKLVLGLMMVWVMAVSVVTYIDKNSQDGIYLGDYSECIKREYKNVR
jgi:hypothetical protein